MIELQVLALIIVLLSVVGSISFNFLLKTFDVKWNRHAKELNEILDIDRKFDHKNEKIQELVKLHTAKYLIQKDEQQYRRKESYFAMLANYDGWIYYLGQMTWRVMLSGLSIWLVVSAFPVTDLLWIGVWSLVFFTFFRVTSVRLSRFLSRQSSATPTKRYEFELRKGGKTQVSGKIRSRKLMDGSPIIYDFIGRPDHINEIHLYKRVSNKNDSKVIYEYMNSREISHLEVEWATSLNKIKLFRRTSPYIPYILPDNRKWTHYPSAFHLVWKD